MGILCEVSLNNASGIDPPLPLCARDEDAFGVTVLVESPTGEQSMHLPMGEEQENQTREIIYPKSVFAVPREWRGSDEVFMSLP